MCLWKKWKSLSSIEISPNISRKKKCKNVSGKLKCRKFVDSHERPISSYYFYYYFINECWEFRFKISFNIGKKSITRLRASWCIQIYLRHTICGWLQVFGTNLNIWWCEFSLFIGYYLLPCAKYSLTHIISKIISQKHKKGEWRVYTYMLKSDLQESMSSWMKQIFSYKIIKNGKSKRKRWVTLRSSKSQPHKNKTSQVFVFIRG